MSVFLTAALQYAAQGFSVFPCQPRSKIPATLHGFKDATKDEATIRAWWDEEPAYNVAIATGEESGIFVLDIDEKPGRTIDEAIEGLPDIPETPHVRTGGGGLQFFFRYPTGSNLTISGGRLGLGIDTRGNGGYVVAPPSIHPHGTGYAWIDSEGLTLAATPQWIVDRLAKQVSGAKQLAGAKLSGGRHDVMLTMAALQRGIGMAPPEIEAALHKMISRLDLSDGRVIDPKEIERIAQWTGDKSMGDTNIESVLHGGVVAKSLAKQRGALSELLHEPGIEDPGHFPDKFLNVPGVVSQWCEFINRTSHRKQPELALAATLTACGALIGRRLQTVTGGRANLYCLGLCETGGGKERARQAVKEVFAAAGIVDTLGPEDFASESGLISSLVVNPTRLFQVDEIGKLLAAIANPRAGTHLVGIVSALLKLYSSANSIYIGKAYADAERNPTISQPHACVYGTAVPDQAWAALGATAVDDGLLARLWVFMAKDQQPPRARPERLPVPQALRDTILSWVSGRGSALGGGSQGDPRPATVQRTPEADKIFCDLEDEAEALERRMAGHPLRKLWTRTAQKADQLSLIYAWSRDVQAQTRPPTIDAEAALWACGLAQYLTQSMIVHANRHLAGSTFEGDLKAVLRYVEEAGTEGRSRTDLIRRFQKLGKRGLDDVMTLATASEQVVEQSIESATRTGRRYVLTRFADARRNDV